MATDERVHKNATESSVQSVAPTNTESKDLAVEQGRKACDVEPVVSNAIRGRDDDATSCSEICKKVEAVIFAFDVFMDRCLFMLLKDKKLENRELNAHFPFLMAKFSDAIRHGDEQLLKGLIQAMLTDRILMSLLIRTFLAWLQVVRGQCDITDIMEKPDAIVDVIDAHTDAPLRHLLSGIFNTMLKLKSIPVELTPTPADIENTINVMREITDKSIESGGLKVIPGEISPVSGKFLSHVRRTLKIQRIFQDLEANRITKDEYDRRICDVYTEFYKDQPEPMSQPTPLLSIDFGCESPTNEDTSALTRIGSTLKEYIINRPTQSASGIWRRLFGTTEPKEEEFGSPKIVAAGGLLKLREEWADIAPELENALNLKMQEMAAWRQANPCPPGFE